MNRVVLAAVLTAVASVASADAGWLSSYDAAVQESRKTGKPIMVDFTGSDWCGWCIRLEKEVFSKPVFKSWAKQNVVLLRLDYPRAKPQPPSVKKANMAIARRYQISGFPTVLFLNAKGNILGKYGYDSGGATFWTKNAETIMRAGKGRFAG